MALSSSIYGQFPNEFSSIMIRILYIYLITRLQIGLDLVITSIATKIWRKQYRKSTRKHSIMKITVFTPMVPSRQSNILSRVQCQTMQRMMYSVLLVISTKSKTCVPFVKLMYQIYDLHQYAGWQAYCRDNKLCQIDLKSANCGNMPISGTGNCAGNLYRGTDFQHVTEK